MKVDAVFVWFAAAPLEVLDPLALAGLAPELELDLVGVGLTGVELNVMVVAPGIGTVTVAPAP